MARPCTFQKGIQRRSTAPKTNASMRSFNGDGPMGFCAPTVAIDAASFQQCNRCHRQTSITRRCPSRCGSAIYLMTQDKKGVSAMKLHRHLGISYNAAWRIRHKLIDDGARPRAPAQRVDPARRPISAASEAAASARGAPGKTPFVAAVNPLRMKLTVVEGFRLTEIAAWAQLHLGKGTMGWAFMASPRRAAFMSRWWWAAGEPLSSAPSFDG